MTRLRLFVLAATFATWPGVAHAQGGLWDFLEQFSGPGPFTNGVVLEFRPLCQVAVPAPGLNKSGTSRDETDWIKGLSKRSSVMTLTDQEVQTANEYPCFFRAPLVKAYLEVRAAWASTGADRPLLADRPTELTGKVTAYDLEVFLMRQLAPPFAFGAGVGALWFSGANVEGTVARLVVTPISVAVAPFKIVSNRRIADFVTLRYEQKLLVKGLDQKNDRVFNRTSTSDFRTGADLVQSVSIIFNIFALLYHPLQ